METETLEDKKNRTIRCITEAAREVFAEVGFEGARVDEIARRAGINKAMIYYRIGDKESLYAKVLHEVLSDTVKRIADNIKVAQSPSEKLETYVHTKYGTDLVRILNTLYIYIYYFHILDCIINEIFIIIPVEDTVSPFLCHYYQLYRSAGHRHPGTLYQR